VTESERKYLASARISSCRVRRTDRQTDRRESTLNT